jgi:diacylglycerol kinase
MQQKQPFSLRDRIKSFNFSLQGIVTFFKNEHNARIHAVAAFGVIALGLFCKLNRMEWCWITLAIGLVILSEMFNTAIEYLTDLVSPEMHPLAKKTKDVASGAVLIAALMAVVIGLFIFIPKFV